MTDVPTAERADAGRPGFYADEMAAITGGRLLRRSARRVRGAAVDSRLVRPGQLFVALPGERTDGHRHLAPAAASGAAALVVTRGAEDLPDLDTLGDVAVLQVADGLAALGALATAWRSRFRPLVVGITGSIAKTSTKEATASLLERRFTILKSEGNQNNEIGLPLTVLDLGPEHEAVVLEMGMYVGEEIADLARIGQPSVGVVTAVQGVHLSRIGSLDAIERAKGELVEALPSTGVAILNADDPRVRRMAERTSASVLTYGFSEDADVRGAAIEAAGYEGMRFRLELPGSAVDVSIPTLGRLSVHNGLAAAAVALAAGMEPPDIASGLAAGWSAPHRSEIHRAAGITVVDDAYNASPGAVVAALDLLAGLPGRRVAVLGEMLELGETAAAGHREVGVAAAGSDLELLVVVGAGARGIAEGALAAGFPDEAVIVVDDRDAALEALTARLRPGDVVLVKASRGAALDELVEPLLRAVARS